jgi:hypothetical protein
MCKCPNKKAVPNKSYKEIIAEEQKMDQLFNGSGSKNRNFSSLVDE